MTVKLCAVISLPAVGRSRPTSSICGFLKDRPDKANDRIAANDDRDESGPDCEKKKRRHGGVGHGNLPFFQVIPSTLAIIARINTLFQSAALRLFRFWRDRVSGLAMSNSLNPERAHMRADGATGSRRPCDRPT
jgi:hypothetical protein